MKLTATWNTVEVVSLTLWWLGHHRDEARHGRIAGLNAKKVDLSKCSLFHDTGCADPFN
jgi:hypothetical protein